MAEENTAKGKKVAAVLIRGLIHVRHDFKKTLQHLNLYNQHNCIILENTSINLGMLRKVKDFIAYGPVSDEVIAELEKSKKKVKGKTYRLNPPRGGFERKGIKTSFGRGGALGRRPSMDALIKKML
ncbi:uL30 family ribosomal protein [Candidatus Woesearchaeota archaeon]|nr:uL30 family ribosomal protein [Candidatus Woesearchaeota archaeon]MBW3013738.1 uL30 family ribosomal protein [Candidatus Woesearchaeota archaeon]